MEPATTPPPTGTTGRADVELRLPADGAFVSVVRTATAGLAARLDFTIDDFEDARIAVGEACALVLAEAEPGSDLTVRFFLQPGELTVRVSTPTAAPVPPDEDSWAWQVLSAMATSAETTTAGGTFEVSLTVRSVVLG